MTLPKIILLRFSLLLLIITSSVLPNFGRLDYTLSLIITGFIAINYFIVGAYEVKLKNKRITPGYFRVSYLPYIVISKRVIRIFFFLIMAALLSAPETRVAWLIPLPLVIAAGEIIFFCISVAGKFFGVLFYGDQLFFLQDRERRIFASEVKHVEYRYENFYLVLHSGGTFMINPEFIPVEQRLPFRHEFLKWTRSNSILFTDEAIQKMAAEKISAPSL
jgi:hypothetical protein